MKNEILMLDEKTKYCIFILLVLLTQTLKAQDEKPKLFELKGYVKDMQTTSFVDHPDTLLSTNLIHNRLNFKCNLSEHFTIRAEMRNRIFYGDRVKMIPNYGKIIAIDDGYFDLTKLWVDNYSLVAVSTFDRALVNYSNDKLTLTAGRQRINWGINTVWNPNDLFNAYNFLDFDYSERPGVDALRLQYFPKKISALEFAFKPAKKADQTVAAALVKFNKWKYDFQFLGGVYYKDITIGAGWAGNIKDAGFKGEISWFRNKEDWKSKQENLSASLMADYSFKNAWYVSAAVLYIDKPSPITYGATVLLANNLSAKSLMPYKWSFYTGVMKTFTPLFSANLALIYSPEHNSTILFPTLIYSIAQNFDLDFTLQSFFSEQSGQYKTAGNSMNLRLKWSF